MKDYYLGFDMGTDSIGWAVTDEEYNVLKSHGKAMWGVHLFEEGKTAEERRSFRTARRRTQRQHQRMMLLRELFSEEIFKVDQNFFERLDDSKYFIDDKKYCEKYSIFNDNDYTDIEYHKAYPTIYHLRSELIHSDKKYDIRLIYLAVANIMKHRGHFLFDGLSADETKEFTPVYNDLINTLNDYGVEFNCTDSVAFQEILKDKSITITDKKKRLYALCNAETKQEKTICDILSGGKVTFENLYNDESLKDCEEKNVSFKSGYEDKETIYSSILGERMYILEKLKAVYDWAILAEILDSEQYISDAKVKQYEKHKKDLELLKKLFKKYANESYDEFFNSPNEKANYPIYVGKTSKSKDILKENRKCSQEDMCKCALKLLKNITPENAEEAYILNELSLYSALPKQVCKDNNVIPNQLHQLELKKILDNASKHYSFLNSVSEEKSVKEKIEMLLTFRIPYYVGPLNPHSKKNSWIVKKDTGKIYPWNFDEKVDKEKSATMFIERMTNFCTYLVGEKVLPKESILYSRYSIYNQLNNVKINGEKLPIDIKNKMFFDRYLEVNKPQKMTTKGIEKYLKAIGYCAKSDEIEVTGIDKEIVGTMKSYVEFKNILGSLNGKEEMVENIISKITVLGESKDLLKAFIEKEYGDVLTKEQISAICKLKYNGWGNFSKKFLTEINSVNVTNGEYFNIVTALENTNCNLMQLLGSEYNFKNEIDEFNKSQNNIEGELSYKLVEDLYVSPSVKRSIWRTLLVAKEIVSVQKKAPAKIFVEMARGANESQMNKRTVSRKDQLLLLYKNCKKEAPELFESLSNTDENRLRSDKLFLYYLQFGKCAYSGEPIDIEDLNDKNKYDVDHIYPQSKTKDDSLDNRVLVKGSLNKEKSDKYPLPTSFKTPKTKALWDKMKYVGTLSKEKYYRLTRTTPLTNDELAGFIARQIVETRQSTKVVASLLKQIYKDTEIVYVKAGNVSRFRQQYDLLKSRSVNDYHHAKDAYLNIVVGNVYNTKFTKNPVNFIKGAQVYSLNRMFDYNVERGGKVAWTVDDNKSLKTVIKYMNKNNILFTRYATEQKGGFFDQMPLKAGNGQLPLKTTDDRLLNIERYGGYNGIKGAYFALVKHIVKGKEVKTIEFVPIYLASKIEKDKRVLDNYFSTYLENPQILIRKIKINSLFEIDGFKMHLSGRTGKRLVFKGANQLILSKKQYDYFKKIDNYIDRNKKLKGVQPISSYQHITKEENLDIYDTFTDKLINTIYNKRLSSQVKTFIDGREIFINLSIEEQCILLSEAIKLFQCNTVLSNMVLIGGSANSGILLLSNNICKLSRLSIINQSVTGLFENKTDLATL